MIAELIYSRGKNADSIKIQILNVLNVSLKFSDQELKETSGKI